jgi:hypothetical protein
VSGESDKKVNMMFELKTCIINEAVVKIKDFIRMQRLKLWCELQETEHQALLPMVPPEASSNSSRLVAEHSSWPRDVKDDTRKTCCLSGK